MKEWGNIPDNIEEYAGFVYIIENTFDGKYYIGQKKFWKEENRVLPIKLTKPELIRRENLYQKYANGVIKTKKEYNQLLQQLKKAERVRHKGKKRTTHKVKVETKWRSYFGSNDALKEDYRSLGAENFVREILFPCKTKGMMNYVETYLQLKYHVLFNEDSYNRVVNIRANPKMFEGYTQEELDQVMKDIKEL